MTTPPETNQAAPAEVPEYDGPVSEVADDGRFGENRVEDPYEPGRRASNAFRIGVGVLVLLIFATAWWIGRDNRAEHRRAQAGGVTTSRLDVPKRVYFPAARTDAIGALVDPQAAAATSLMAGWWSSHGTKPDDKAFITWLAAALPGPTGDRTAEMAQLKATVAGQEHGTSEYLPAARFLTKQGLGTAPAPGSNQAPIWGLEAAAQAGLYDANTNNDIGKWTSAAVSLASKIAAKAGTRLQLSSPYVTDPSLAPDLKFTRKGACPCSYPAITPRSRPRPAACSAPCSRRRTRSTPGCSDRSTTPRCSSATPTRATSSAARCSATRSVSTSSSRRRTSSRQQHTDRHGGRVLARQRHRRPVPGMVPGVAQPQLATRVRDQSFDEREPQARAAA